MARCKGRWLFLLAALFSMLSGWTSVDGDEVKRLRFRRHVLNATSEFSACAVFDVNHDGRLDIFCGGFWYEAPDWKRHVTREVPSIRGRFDDYSNLPLDVNHDGWTDVVSVNYRSESIFWVEHPGASLGPWTTHIVDNPGSSETGRLYDIDGDGQLDLLPNGTKFAAWYEVRRHEPGSIEWLRHDLPDEAIGHGIGFGDIDGDGRGDMVAPTGWLQAPVDPRQGRWRHRAEFRLHRDCSIPILVHDVDQDGDQDIIWGRGHNIGLYWLEQQSTADGRQWLQHAVDTSWSSIHSIMLADLDGNGRPEVVAGKRYLGHGGKDPGETDPLVVYRYEYSPIDRVWTRDLISFGGNCGFDLDPKFADLDADGDLDLVAPTRAGLCWLENLGRRSDGEAVTGDLPIAYDDATSAKLLELRTSAATRQKILSPTDWGHRRWQILRNMEKVMGPLPGPEQRVPLDVRIEREEQAAGYRRVKLTYAADAGDRVPAFLLIPDDCEDAPAALCLHPTSQLGKSQICGLGGNPDYFYAHELAQRGYVCLAPDYPPFGDYQDYDFRRRDVAYASGSMKAIWNNIRALDLLESLPEVNRDRIVCLGHSLGGHNALFTAAFDQRIRAVMTSCGFTAFDHYYDGDLRGWTSDRYMPRIRTQFGLDPDRVPFDFHEVLAAIAPRPVFISAPNDDANFDQFGVRRAVEKASAVFGLFGDTGRLLAVYPNGGHDFSEDVRQRVYEWFDDNL